MREEIDRLIAEGAAGAASLALGQFWRSDPGPQSAGFVVSRFEKLRESTGLLPYRLAILRSFTVEPVVPVLRAAAFAAGIDLQVHLGDFNAYAQEILDPGSSLYAFEPQAVVLAVQSYEISALREWLKVFRGRSAAYLILHTVESAVSPARGVLDSQIPDGQWEAAQRLNRELREMAREFRGAYVLDYDALVARFGRESWRDERKWLTMRMPVAAGHLIHLAQEWMRFLHPLTGKIAKVLAVDLDNTVWGGVIGEDGMEGIQLGAEYPGAAFQALQRVLLDFNDRGILLAVCSKNNPQDALEAIDNHPGMLLQRRHLACLKINWADKAQNLREIALELNVGLDSIAFVDDNPVEREHARKQAPEVMVIDLPAKPMEYAQALRDSPVFERLSLSDEDAQRGQYYAAERERRELQQTSGSPEEFYRSLQQELEVAPVTPMTLARVAQLTQKTNQFNLTTRRYSEQDIAAMESSRVYSLRVKDQYCDNGLVGVAIVEDRGEVCEIDTLLLSCRVIGRTVETAFLSRLAAEASGRGMRKMEGRFLPTRKNAPAKDFFVKHGFEQVEENAEGSRWTYDLSNPIECPDWIRFL
ncbi:MAG: HAD-IIIC family phosphatase [Bryobacteraceae bacterium]